MELLQLRPPVRHVARLFAPQLPLLKARWKQILFGAVFQYVHAMSTQLAHRMHEPMEQPLGDIGFKYLPVSVAPLRRHAPARAARAGRPPRLPRRRSWACATRG